MSRSGVISAAKVKLYVSGRVFGRVLSFRWSSQTPKKPLHGIDSTDPYELAVTTTKVMGSITVLRLSGDAGAEGVGIAAPFEELSREQYFSLMLVEHHTDRILFQAARCSLESQEWDVPSRGLITGNLNFTALEWSNEIGTKPSIR